MSRSTKQQLREVDSAITQVLNEEHPATLRSVYYRVVSLGAVDKTEADYRKVGRQLVKLRRARVIPWSWVTDGTRWVIKPKTYRGVNHALAEIASLYRKVVWEDQDAEVLIFAEKDAISGVIYEVTEQYAVPLAIVRGYASETFAYELAEDINAWEKETWVYNLGDHDPSGVNAWENLQRKVTGFLVEDFNQELPVHFDRLAVTPDQIVEWDLPTRPTKTTDKRAAKFSGDSVEVDAISPSTLRALVRWAIEQHIDLDQYELTIAEEEKEQATIKALAA